MIEGVIRTVDGITAEWLGSVLGVEGLELDGVEAIGTGQMSKSYRVRDRRPQGERRAWSSSSRPPTKTAATLG